MREPKAFAPSPRLAGFGFPFSRLRRQTRQDLAPPGAPRWNSSADAPLRVVALTGTATLSPTRADQTTPLPLRLTSLEFTGDFRLKTQNSNRLSGILDAKADIWIITADIKQNSAAACNSDRYKPPRCSITVTRGAYEKYLY